MTIFDSLVALFEAEQANYRVIEHPPEGKSDLIATLRGTTPSQAAKAMVCNLAGGPNEGLALVIVPGDRRVDLDAVARYFSAKKAKFADLEKAEAATGCVSGSIPPVVMTNAMPMVVDADLIADEAYLAFNAGRLDRSIIIATADYLRVVKPETAYLTSIRRAT
jgi:Ala-tRNA(Pro) deacylase